MADSIDIQDEYGNVGRSIRMAPDEHDPMRWILDQPTVLTAAECDRAFINLEGREPERLGRQIGTDGAPIAAVRFVPPTSHEALDAARSGGVARATPRPE